MHRFLSLGLLALPIVILALTAAPQDNPW